MRENLPPAGKVRLEQRVEDAAARITCSQQAKVEQLSTELASTKHTLARKSQAVIMERQLNHQLQRRIRELECELERSISSGERDSHNSSMPHQLRRRQMLRRSSQHSNRSSQHRNLRPSNLIKRLQRRRDQSLRFMRDLTVPFDHNGSERDLRMIKLQQKVSGCCRTSDGARNFCRVRSYLSTAHKQGYSLLYSLERLLNGKPIAFQ